MRKVRQAAEKRRRGAALVETAIVLPVFFLIVLGIIEFGRAFMVMQLVTTAAREGTRTAISDGTTNSEVTTMIKEMVSNTASIAQHKIDVDVDIEPYQGNPDPEDDISKAHKRDTITIDVSVDFTDVSFIAPMVLSGANIRGSSSMRHE